MLCAVLAGVVVFGLEKGDLVRALKLIEFGEDEEASVQVGDVGIVTRVPGDDGAEAEVNFACCGLADVARGEVTTAPPVPLVWAVPVWEQNLAQVWGMRYVLSPEEVKAFRAGVPDKAWSDGRASTDLGTPGEAFLLQKGKLHKALKKGGFVDTILKTAEKRVQSSVKQHLGPGQRLCTVIYRRFRAGERTQLPLHRDHGIAGTVTIGMSDDAGFTGGAYVQNEPGRKQFLGPPSGHALLYKSDVLHGVEIQPTGAGVRFSLNLWYRSGDCDKENEAEFHRYDRDGDGLYTIGESLARDLDQDHDWEVSQQDLTARSETSQGALSRLSDWGDVMKPCDADSSGTVNAAELDKCFDTPEGSKLRQVAAVLEAVRMLRLFDEDGDRGLNLEEWRRKEEVRMGRANTQVAREAILQSFLELKKNGADNLVMEANRHQLTAEDVVWLREQGMDIEIEDRRKGATAQTEEHHNS
eukprot:Hpha_TRINITY_DN28023_c0_g1::TRINITY_DN28023_c0_g1_i1::g.42514::m.42514